MDKSELRDLIAQVVAELGASNETGSKRPEPIANGESDEAIPDLSKADFRNVLATPNPACGDEFLKLKKKSTARVGIWRAGPRYLTETYLRVRADHAKAIDAVFEDVPDEIIEKLGLLRLQTRCQSKDDYLTRPDLGRQFDEETISLLKSKCMANPEVMVIVADGLSSTSVVRNIEDVFPALLQGLKLKNIKVGTPVFVKYGRVGAMDAITEAVGAEVTIIFLGERPGLATSDSLSAYMTYGGYVGIPEAARTVVSNIYAGGTNPVEAGAHISDLVERMLREKKSGLELSR